MKKCILCETDKEDNEFNKEHVIPKQLGGTLTIENLCKDCNSKLGNELDQDIARNILYKTYKLGEKIKSNRRNFINPFPIFTSEEDENRQIEMGHDEEGNLKITHNPQAKSTMELKGDKISGEIIKAEFSIDATIPEDERLNKIKELCEQEGCKLTPEDEEKIKSRQLKTRSVNSKESFYMSEEVDLWPIIQLYVRIAYEIAFYKLGDSYFDDPMKNKLKNYLESDDHDIENLDERHGIIVNYFPEENEVAEPIKHLADYKKHNDADRLLHFILIFPMMIDGVKQINVLINLFNKRTFRVLISEDFDNYDIKSFNAILMFKNRSHIEVNI
ncbi:hypothetical protein MBCUT_00220 [Methanobrevibacter cuticularis]|uniref:HNH endonuclease 5 domain-containing protein n=1 Tax=Methanobrevibacter cuticularis TaxID=47311 RepID=A0A166FJ29_9EURY|nr:HNH endonuclease [Methanobrevibacter cuticularis]KZX17728.1 hypothetical protein MBCUT_00220 [Methanobrevibacter cuticularis]